MAFLAAQGLFVGSGVLESPANLIALAGTLVLILMLVALGAFAYRSLNGELEWPGETDETESDDDGLRRGRTDDEWKYY